MKAMRVFTLLFGMAVLVIFAGCGDSQRKFVALGDAPLERKAEFAVAIVRACAGFDGLDDPAVKFEVTTNANDCSITVGSKDLKPSGLLEPIAVAMTNLSMEYPGLGFMSNDDGTWKILMPADVKIPVDGKFGIGSE